MRNLCSCAFALSAIFGAMAALPGVVAADEDLIALDGQAASDELLHKQTTDGANPADRSGRDAASGLGNMPDNFADGIESTGGARVTTMIGTASTAQMLGTLTGNNVIAGP